MEEQKPINLDGEGFDILKDAVLELLNEFPGLDGREISFSSLTVDGGISLEPESGALVYTERKDILGGTTQECQFPCFVVYRSAATSEFQKLKVSTFLETLGAWVCKEPIILDGSAYQLTEYPKLNGNRKITGVTRFNTYALEENQNRTQDWVIPITVNYTHEFNMW